MNITPEEGIITGLRGIDHLAIEGVFDLSTNYSTQKKNSITPKACKTHLSGFLAAQAFYNADEFFENIWETF